MDIKTKFNIGDKIYTTEDVLKIQERHFDDPEKLVQEHTIETIQITCDTFTEIVYNTFYRSTSENGQSTATFFDDFHEDDLFASKEDAIKFVKNTQKIELEKLQKKINEKMKNI